MWYRGCRLLYDASSPISLTIQALDNAHWGTAPVEKSDEEVVDTISVERVIAALFSGQGVTRGALPVGDEIPDEKAIRAKNINTRRLKEKLRWKKDTGYEQYGYERYERPERRDPEEKAAADVRTLDGIIRMGLTFRRGPPPSFASPTRKMTQPNISWNAVLHCNHASGRRAFSTGRSCRHATLGSGSPRRTSTSFQVFPSVTEIGKHTTPTTRPDVRCSQV